MQPFLHVGKNWERTRQEPARSLPLTNLFGATKTTTIANQIGSTGKTTNDCNLDHALSYEKKVLFVNLNLQGNLRSVPVRHAQILDWVRRKLVMG
ncbi:MAG: AAA family ATPase [Gorillibacterium sp.]|nr:AAA family ATPase [Gorillibacterium sp.]